MKKHNESMERIKVVSSSRVNCMKEEEEKVIEAGI